MANLSDKNFPDGLKLELKTLAAGDGKTLEQFVRKIIFLGLAAYGKQRAELFRKTQPADGPTAAAMRKASRGTLPKRTRS